MKTIILCVDRDNDLGVKAGVEGPLIGRRENIRGAIALGLRDPEDADTNTILAALSMYDELKRGGIDVEIATICGDMNVGYESDRELTRQLDRVLEKVKPDGAILVSDGAEDEYIFPMISSRVKIDSVRRVFVKQNPNIESTYYLLLKAFKDERWRLKLFTPISLVLIMYGLIVSIPILYDVIVGGEIARIADGAFGFIILTLGLWLMWRAYRVSEALRSRYAATKTSISAGNVSVPFSIAAIILIIIGLISGWENLQLYDDTTPQILGFFGGFILWLIFGILVNEAGDLISSLATKKPLSISFFVVMTILIAMGVIMIYPTVVELAWEYIPVPPGSLEELLNVEIAMGIIIIAIGATTKFVGRPKKPLPATSDASSPVPEENPDISDFKASKANSF